MTDKLKRYDTRYGESKCTHVSIMFLLVSQSFEYIIRAVLIGCMIGVLTALGVFGSCTT